MSSEALPMCGVKLSLQFFQAEEQKFIIKSYDNYYVHNFTSNFQFAHHFLQLLS